MTRSRFLVAPPGTRIGEPGWREPWPGLTLSWDIHGKRPELAVQRDGVLLGTGLPTPEFPVEPSIEFWIGIERLT